MAKQSSKAIFGGGVPSATGVSEFPSVNTTSTQNRKNKIVETPTILQKSATSNGLGSGGRSKTNF